MVVRFKHVSIENFLSFGQAEIDLNDRGYTSLVGINRCITDNSANNGAGKTTIAESVCYALTGTTIRGVKSNLVNIHTTGGMKVALDFEVDGTLYKIIRTKDHKELGTTIKLYVNGEDKSGKGVRDTEKLIGEYLPDLTFELVSSVIILGQGMPQKFTANTPSGRKEVLEKLSKSDFMIEDIKARLTSRKSILSAQIREHELKIAGLGSQQKAYEQQLLQFQAQIDSLTAPDPQALQETQQKLESLQLRRDALSDTLQEQKHQADILSQQQVELSTKQSEEVERLKNQYQNEIESTRQKIYQISAECQNLAQEIKRLESVVDICPTCGQRLPDVHKVDTTGLHSQLCEKKDEEMALSATLQEVMSLQQQAVAAVESKYKQERLATTNQLLEVRNAVDSIGREISSYDGEIKHLSVKGAALQAAIDNYEQVKQSINASIQVTKEAVDKLEQEIVYYTVGKDQLGNRLEAINKMVAIATRDFRGFLLTGVIEYIDSRAKSYCQDIFETDKLQFALDGNNLNITYDGKLYENLSGGEQKKVDIIAQLSLRDMLCQFSGFSCNLLVLDEFTDALDAVGCQKVIDTITKRLTDIESVFLVTHRSNLSLPTDNVITVIKDENGVSRIA